MVDGDAVQFPGPSQLVIVTCCAAGSPCPCVAVKLSDEGSRGQRDGGDVGVFVDGTDVGVLVGVGVFVGEAEVCVSVGDGPGDPTPLFCAPQVVKSTIQAIRSRTRNRGGS